MSNNGYPDDFFFVNKIMEKFTGLWLPGREINLILRILYYVAVAFAYTITMYFFICEIIIVQETIKDINKFVSQFGMLFSHVVGILKLYILVFYRKTIRNIMDVLQDKKYTYKPYGAFQPGRMLNNAKKLSSGVSLALFGMYTCVGLFAHVSSSITMNKRVKGNYFQGNESCYDYTPYYFYIPFNVNTKSGCEAAFVFMDVSLDVFGFILATHDGLFVTFLNCLKTQIKIVQGAFCTIRERCLKKIGLPVDYEIFQDKINPKLEKVLYGELTHSIQHLNILLKLCLDIENLFTYVILAQTLGSLIIFASCLYVAATVSINSSEFIVVVQYFFCVLVQLSVICFFGNQITIASEEIGLSQYQCDWLSSSSRFKCSMIITMCRTHRPLYLSIGKFSPLTLATLVAVCRGSFSCFALFKSIQQ